MKNRMEEFKKFIEIDEASGCWIWIGEVDYNGYGKIKDNGLVGWAHKISYTLFIGDIPMVRMANRRSRRAMIKQSCEKKLCVNPKHLSAVAWHVSGKSGAYDDELDHIDLQ